jgi:hypothetical protein
MSTSRIGKGRRLQEVYAGGAIAVFMLIAAANGAWVPAVAVAALGLGLVLFPAQRRAIVLTTFVAAAAAAGLVLAARRFP